MIQQNRLKREKSLLTFPEWEMFLKRFFSGVKSLSPCALSTPSLMAMKRTPFFGKVISVNIPTCK